MINLIISIIFVTTVFAIAESMYDYHLEVKYRIILMRLFTSITAIFIICQLFMLFKIYKIF